MKLDTAIKQLKHMYDLACAYRYVKKPISWALYHTWRWADKIEKARQQA